MDPHKSSSIDLLEQVTNHMRANGLRRVRIVRGELELDVEVDPAHQYLPSPAGEDLKSEPEQKREGACSEPGCDANGGHLGSAYCRPHWQKAMNGE
jgi:hypothetical protein